MFYFSLFFLLVYDTMMCGADGRYDADFLRSKQLPRHTSSPYLMAMLPVNARILQIVHLRIDKVCWFVES